MRLAQLKPGEVVEVNIRGTSFPARVTGTPAAGRIPIEPLAPGFGYHAARARQVRGRLEQQGRLV